MSQQKLSAFFSSDASRTTEKKTRPSENDNLCGVDSVKKVKFDPKYDNSRIIKADWFSIFPWLEVDKRQNVFRCSLCVKAKKRNVFVSGKSTGKPKKDDFIKHERGEDHKQARRLPEQRQEMQTAVTAANSQARDGVIATMKTLLCLVQADVPNCKVSTIVDLQVENGATILNQMIKDEGPAHYTHHESLDEMLGTMKCIVDQDLFLKVADAGLYAIEADEATDSANKSILMVYIRFVSTTSNEPESHFLGVRQLAATTADDIYKCLIELLEERGLDVAKMVGMAADGASVMQGVRSGVTTQFKKTVPFLVTNHCLAHRLQLASEKAADQVPLIAKYIGSLNTFAKALKFSPKLTRTLENSKQLHQESATKITQVFFTRWLSFADSTQALAGCIPSVISCLYVAAAERADKVGKACLYGLTKTFATFRFIHLTAFLADAVGLLGILSRAMQVANPTYDQVKTQVTSCITALEALRHMKGPNLAKLSKDFPKEPPSDGETTYGGHIVKDTAKDREKYHEAVSLFLDEIVVRLETMLPDTDIMEAFACLWTKREDEREIQRLIDMYGHEKTKNGVTHQALIEPSATLQEWYLLQEMVHEYGSMHSLQKFLQKNSDAYPNTSVLIKVALTIPVTSVNCERGISRYTAIKTETRSSLKVGSVEQLMTLSIEAPYYKAFNYEKAFTEWCMLKNRRQYQSLAKEAEKQMLLSKDTEKIKTPDYPLDLSLLK